MDVTALARSLLEPIPAHRTAGLEVLRIAEVSLLTPPELTNVIGSLHSSGLITLADAAGLVAIIAAVEAEDEMRGVLPLGAAATLEFRAPARGLLTASCRLGAAERQALRPVLSGRQKRARIVTVADITDEAHALVCRGTFEWSVRRP
jgi:acyl-coenzyme A thioesterase PaaI-like protein